MDSQELVSYIFEGMKWAGLGGLTCLGAYFSALTIHTLVLESSLFHKRIKSEEELRKVVNEECRLLDLDPESFDMSYGGTDSMVRKNGGRWELRISSNYLATRPMVRHELYHMKRDVPDVNPDGKINQAYYFFVAEPGAKIYGTLGIKL